MVLVSNNSQYLGVEVRLCEHSCSSLNGMKLNSIRTKFTVISYLKNCPLVIEKKFKNQFCSEKAAVFLAAAVQGSFDVTRHKYRPLLFSFTD